MPATQDLFLGMSTNAIKSALDRARQLAPDVDLIDSDDEDGGLHTVPEQLQGLGLKKLFDFTDEALQKLCQETGGLVEGNDRIDNLALLMKRKLQKLGDKKIESLRADLKKNPVSLIEGAESAAGYDLRGQKAKKTPIKTDMHMPLPLPSSKKKLTASQQKAKGQRRGERVELRQALVSTPPPARVTSRATTTRSCALRCIVCEH